MVTVPRCKPASCTVWLAVPSGCPTKLGMTSACGCRRCGDQQTDFGIGDAAGVRGRSLRENFAFRCIRQLHLRDGADIQTAAADVDVGGALALSDDIGDSDTLRSQAFGDADLPALPHLASGRRKLRQDFSFRYGGAVILAFDGQIQSALSAIMRATAGFLPTKSGTATSCP